MPPRFLGCLGSLKQRAELGQSPYDAYPLMTKDFIPTDGMAMPQEGREPR